MPATEHKVKARRGKLVESKMKVSAEPEVVSSTVGYDVDQR